MHGNFVRADGLILPNNISRAGARSLLNRAFRPTPETAVWYIGLCTGAPSPTMVQSDINEPNIGVNGYTRQNCDAEASWPDEGESGGQRYIQTKWFTFEAVGGGFSKPIQRAFITNGTAYAAGDPVFAMSAPLPTEMSIIESTPEEQRTFRYQLFL